MRVSRDVAAKNRRKVVDAASREFRSNGYDGIGVAGLMKSAGMTHGGFYKQFDSKDALIAEATEQALKQNFDYWERTLHAVGGDPLPTLRDWYLSQDHLNARDRGCTFATLAAEAPRHGAPLQDVFTAAVERQVADLARRLEGEGDADARGAALRAMAQMIGSMVLARAVSDPDLQDEILNAARNV
ncbi:TetR/AcrR family transcriptional regulator [Chachezhania antarctica]|uniref:TetR/AcrR family transcriptional regulator n=1 Tax=Chachezhania antarctica TaxID=2340860 RepID=UPI000EAD2CF6|nr:TetR/AcrR family transcriptional regulator [Chachezhania antarctica]